MMTKSKRGNEQLSEKINKTILNQTFQNQYQGFSLNTKYAIIDANILILRPNLSIPILALFSPIFSFCAQEDTLFWEEAYAQQEQDHFRMNVAPVIKQSSQVCRHF